MVSGYIRRHCMKKDGKFQHTMSRTKYGLESGNCCFKTVFTSTDKLDKTETITVYNDDKTV